MTSNEQQVLGGDKRRSACAYLTLAALSTVSLIVMAGSLVPVGKESRKWAQCYEHNISFNKANFADANMSKPEAKAWATRFCNGGGGSAMPRATQ